MIRANAFPLARKLIVAATLVAAMAFAMTSVTSSAFARISPDQSLSEAVVLKDKSPEDVIQLAQKKRFKQRRYQKRRFEQRRRNDGYKKPRRKKARGLNNRQSNSAVSSGRAASLGNVARSVRRRVPGQLLDARLMKDRRGKLTYRLRILGRNGVMRNVTADAYTGAILGVR